MANFHFITNPTTLSIIQAILDIAGPNFNAPYDSAGQPINANARNNEDLIQYQVPGGTSLKGYSEPSITESMGSAINSMLVVLAPVISAYGLILPILGVIRGIIEVLCAMMNPFAVIKAVIRLFKKWIPPFISLFPPLAGVIIIISTIKAILAIVFFILTVVVPTIQLIIFNVKTLAAGFGGDSNAQSRAAAKEKLKTLVKELVNQSGVLGVLAPLLNIIFLILKLVSGFPCSKKKTKKGKKKRMDLTKVSANFSELDEDASCCDDDTCPDIIRNPPSGKGILIPATYCGLPPFFAMKIVTNSSKVSEYKKFSQNWPDQLNCQLDEEVDFGKPAKFDGDMTTLRVEIKSRRGNGRKINIPVVKVKGSDLIVVSAAARKMIGSVEWALKPNPDLMVMYGFIGLGCHPDVEAAKEEIENRFPDLDDSVVDKFPGIGALENDFNNLNSNLNSLFNRLTNQIEGDGSDASGGVVGVVNKDPPYDDDIIAIQAIQDETVALLGDFANNLTALLNDMLAKTSDRVNSTLDVDKTIVRADNKDKATIIVVPRDVTGSNLAQNLPAGVNVQVDLFTDFGFITNQRRNNATGEILADLTSTTTGIANITAKINSNFILTVDDTGAEVVRSIPVRFVADALLPTRRFVTKPDTNIQAPTGNADSEPGKN